ncbi:MAG: hypothetical protein A2V88_08310 [Elusimicrobia bacterium RBG_16_66_12]|nr:MAG: hypothetical protein A2V88_08310 [Elusimicrobia bacterium RBG_16_66_12]
MILHRPDFRQNGRYARQLLAAIDRRQLGYHETRKGLARQVAIGLLRGASLRWWQLAIEGLSADYTDECAHNALLCCRRAHRLERLEVSR